MTVEELTNIVNETLVKVQALIEQGIFSDEITGRLLNNAQKAMKSVSAVAGPDMEVTGEFVINVLNAVTMIETVAAEAKALLSERPEAILS